MTGHATQPTPVAVLPETGMVYRQMDDGAWYPLDVDTPTDAIALHACDVAALVRYVPAVPAGRDLTADGQRAAERARNELARGVTLWSDTEMRAVLDEHDLLRAELAGARRDERKAEIAWTRASIDRDRLHRQNEHLRAELHGATSAAAALRTLGDALADQAVDAAGRLSACGEDDMSDATLTQVQAWRSVPGDASTHPSADDMSWPVDGPDPINALRDLPGAHPHIDIVTARLHALIPPALEAGCPECGSDDDCDDYDWATRARLEAAVLAVFEEYGYREGGSLARLAVIAIEELDSAVAPDVPWRAVHDLSLVAADGEQMAQTIDEPTALLIANAVNAYRTGGSSPASTNGDQ